MAERPDEPAESLERSPEEGARRLALSYLEQAAAALPRLADPEDGEALHDLRVALRRLRSCLGSYERQLAGSVPKKLARRLKRLARATGPGRDAEVQLEWLRKQGPELRNHRHRQGLAWLRERLEQRLDRAYRELREEAARDFARVEAGLRRRLSVFRAKVRLDESPPPTFGGAGAEILLEHAEQLERRLGSIEDAADVGRAHQARISAKRLRYLADPLAAAVQASGRQGQGPGQGQGRQGQGKGQGQQGPGQGQGQGQGQGEQLVHRLKGLQDLLGELHDAHVQEAELAAALGEAAAERARCLLELSLDGGGDDHRLRSARQRAVEPGLLALARLNRGRRDRLYGQFEERWRGERIEQLTAAAEELAAALRSAGHAASGEEGGAEAAAAGEADGKEARAGGGSGEANGEGAAEGVGEANEEGAGSSSGEVDGKRGGKVDVKGARGGSGRRGGKDAGGQ